LLALSTSDTSLALSLLVPSVRDRADERDHLGREHMSGESVQPDGISLNPEPSSRISGNTKDVLDIKSCLNLRVVGLVSTDDVVRGKSRDSQTELGGKVTKIGGGEVLVLELNNTGRGVTSNISTLSSIDNLNCLGSNRHLNFGVEGLSLQAQASSFGGEFRETSYEVDVMSKLVWNGEGTELTSNASSRGVFVNFERGREKLRNNSDGGTCQNVISTVFNKFDTAFNQPSHDLLLVVNGRSD